MYIINGMKRHILLSVIAIITFGTLLAQEATTINTAVNTLKERINLMGYIMGGYTYDDADEADNTFDIKRIILMAEGKVTKEWSLYFMYNFNSAGTLLEAYTDYRFFPGLYARLGQFKVPYTIEGPLSPTVVELVNCYSQSTNYLTAMAGSDDPLRGGTAGRDLGLMIYGDICKKHITYHLGVLNGQGINMKDKNSNKEIVGSLMIHPLDWLSVGGSFTTGKGNAVGLSDINPDINAGENYKRTRRGVGALVKTKPVNVRAEYLGGKDGKVNSEGYYATASFHVAPKVDLIASYDYLNKNKDMAIKQTNYVAGIEYRFYPRCRVQAQYTYCEHTADSSNMIQGQVQVRF